MKSISGKNWIEINKNKRLLEKIKLDHNFEEIIAQIIISRKFTELEILTINNDLKISNPFLNNSDFLRSIDILNQSLLNNDKIMIIGDYDVDGCVSTSLFVNFFKFIKANYSYYIPNRFNDGYGASLDLIKKLIKNYGNDGKHRYIGTDTTGLSVSKDGFYFEEIETVFDAPNDNSWDGKMARLNSLVPYKGGYFCTFDGQRTAFDRYEEKCGICWSPDGKTFHRERLPEPWVSSPHGSKTVRYVYGFDFPLLGR